MLRESDISHFRKAAHGEHFPYAIFRGIGLNEQKDRKADKKKGKKKRFYLSIFAFIMLLFVPVFVYASEMKSDGKTTQVIDV